MLSLASVLLLWFILSLIPRTSRSFPFLNEVLPSIALMIQRGVLWKDISSSMIAILIGFALGFISAIPVAFIMAWYTPVRNIIEPKIVGKQVGLHPLATLIAMFVGTKLFGIVGLFLLPMSLAIAVSLLRERENERNEAKPSSA